MMSEYSKDILFSDNQSGISNIYNIYLTVTDTAGCSNTDSYEVFA